MLMLQMANINFFLTILTKTYPAVLMPSKGVPQILECLFQLRRYAGSTIHAKVGARCFDSALLLSRKWVSDPRFQFVRPHGGLGRWVLSHNCHAGASPPALCAGARRIPRCRINAAFHLATERRIYAAERSARRNLSCALCSLTACFKLS